MSWPIKSAVFVSARAWASLTADEMRAAADRLSATVQESGLDVGCSTAHVFTVRGKRFMAVADRHAEGEIAVRVGEAKDFPPV